MDSFHQEIIDSIGSSADFFELSEQWLGETMVIMGLYSLIDVSRTLMFLQEMVS